MEGKKKERKRAGKEGRTKGKKKLSQFLYKELYHSSTKPYFL